MIDSIEYPEMLPTVQHFLNQSPENTSLFKIIQNQQKVERSPVNSNFQLLNCKENNPMAHNVSSNSKLYKRLRSFDNVGSITKKEHRKESMAEEKEDLSKLISKKAEKEILGDRFIPLR